MSVATAMMEDVRNLAPIGVVRIVYRFFNSDGNRRVSVAGTLNKPYFDAKVTRWMMTQYEA